MRKIRIYTPQSLELNAEIDLDTGPAPHVGTVLRMGVGEELTLFNGEKGEYQTVITFSKKGRVRIKIDGFSEADRESPLKLHLFQGLSKGDHMDFSIQKAVELGVTEITPVFCARSQFKMDAKRLEKKQQHWQQIIISAAQQSWRCELPQLNAPLSFDDAVSSLSASSENIIFDVEATQPLEQISHKQDINCWIGPEGGFSQEEVNQARNADMLVASLGPRVLRTETATVAAISLLQYFAGDLK